MRELACPDNYIIVVTEEFIYSTRNGCEHR